MCYDFANCQNQRQCPEDATNLALFFARGNLSFWAHEACQGLLSLIHACLAACAQCCTSPWFDEDHYRGCVPAIASCSHSIYGKNCFQWIDVNSFAHLSQNVG